MQKKSCFHHDILLYIGMQVQCHLHTYKSDGVYYSWKLCWGCWIHQYLLLFRDDWHDMRKKMKRWDEMRKYLCSIKNNIMGCIANRHSLSFVWMAFLYFVVWFCSYSEFRSFLHHEVMNSTCLQLHNKKRNTNTTRLRRDCIP